MSPTTRRKSSCTRTSRGRKLLLPLCIGCGESGVIHAEALSSRESRTKGIAALDSKVINLVSTDSRVSSKVEGINDAVADVVQPAIDAVQPAVDAIKLKRALTLFLFTSTRSSSSLSLLVLQRVNTSCTSRLGF
ncbi:unnamed protein product [Amoebophrya sp. A25]|nr:unnamed protein product [Amoebophrya sp. A25]|eukprot:GSA25T00020944001.1